jgi:hypothetical protein
MGMQVEAVFQMKSWTWSKIMVDRIVTEVRQGNIGVGMS